MLGRDLLGYVSIRLVEFHFFHTIAKNIVNAMGGADSDIKAVALLLKSPFLENCLRGRAFIVSI